MIGNSYRQWLILMCTVIPFRHLYEITVSSSVVRVVPYVGSHISYAIYVYWALCFINKVHLQWLILMYCLFGILVDRLTSVHLHFCFLRWYNIARIELTLFLNYKQSTSVLFFLNYYYYYYCKSKDLSGTITSQTLQGHFTKLRKEKTCVKRRLFSYWQCSTFDKFEQYIHTCT